MDLTYYFNSIIATNTSETKQKFHFVEKGNGYGYRLPEPYRHEDGTICTFS